MAGVQPHVGEQGWLSSLAERVLHNQYKWALGKARTGGRC